jgi:hypothetical protein
VWTGFTCFSVVSSGGLLWVWLGHYLHTDERLSASQQGLCPTDSKCRTLRSLTPDVWTLNGAIYSGPVERRHLQSDGLWQSLCVTLMTSVVFSGSYFPSLSVESGFSPIESLGPAHPVPKGPDKCEAKPEPHFMAHRISLPIVTFLSTF